MLLLLQATPLPIGLALADRFGCFCLEQEDVWFQGDCLSRPNADMESLICSYVGFMTPSRTNGLTPNLVFFSTSSYFGSGLI